MLSVVDQLGAVLDGLVVVRKAERERVARIVRPLDDLEQLTLDEIHQSHDDAFRIWRSNYFGSNLSAAPLMQ
jgi:hypothetical protein